MRATPAALVLALTAPAWAQQGSQAADPRPPEQAAGQALTSCVAHAMGMAPIAAKNASALAASGLVLMEAYPAFLRSQSQNEFGRGTFAQVHSTEGQVWATGYDSGVCLVTVIGTPEGPVVQRLDQLFAIPGAWKPAKIKQLPGARWSAYEWNSSHAKLTAQMRIAELAPDSPAQGFVSVTIAPKSKVSR